MLKVLYITNIPSPYRVLFFNELGKKCQLTVLYQKSSSSERNNKWHTKSENTYNAVFLKGITTGVDNALCPCVIKYLNNTYDTIIVCGISSPTEILAIEWCKLNNIPYYIEGDGAFAKSGNGLKEKIKRHLIRGAKGYFSTCSEHDKYYICYGAEPSKIFRYKFTSLLKSDILEALVSVEEKNHLRYKLGLKERQIVVAVGRFIYSKGFDVLINTAKYLNNEIGVYIIGDSIIKEYADLIRKNNITNVHFIGFKTKEELANYYKAADVFVLPTRQDVWGLVINEAMAYGLPVITTNKCNAGLELVKNGFNGFVVPVNDIIALKEAIQVCIEKQEEFARNSIAVIVDYTIENMVDDHMHIIDKCVSKSN